MDKWKERIICQFDNSAELNTNNVIVRSFSRQTAVIKIFKSMKFWFAI